MTGYIRECMYPGQAVRAVRLPRGAVGIAASVIGMCVFVAVLAQFN